MSDVWYDQNTNAVTVTASRTDPTTGETVYLDAATVTVTIKNPATGAALTGETFPVTLAKVADVPGKYQGNVSHELATSDRSTVKLEVTIVEGVLQGYIEKIVRVEKRGA